MSLSQRYNSLCPPAKLYFVIQSIAILLLFVQNLRDTHHYRIGSYKIPLNHHNIYYFLVKIAVLLFWTWMLSKLCSKQYEGVAWFLVLIPFILFFVAIGMLVVSGLHKSKELTVGATKYQPIFMRQPQPPPHTVLYSGHTASCNCPKCPPPPVYATPASPPLATQTSPPIVYGREGPITQNFPVQTNPPSTAPQQIVVQ